MLSKNLNIVTSKRSSLSTSNKSTCPSLVTLPDKNKLFWQQNKTAKVHQTVNAVKVKVNSAVSISRKGKL